VRGRWGSEWGSKSVKAKVNMVGNGEWVGHKRNPDMGDQSLASQNIISHTQPTIVGEAINIFS
jgi:hypothetical protein